MIGGVTVVPQGGSSGMSNIQKPTNYVCDLILDRDALILSPSAKGSTALVKDASDDPTVSAGWAIYSWEDGTWTKIAEGESQDFAEFLLNYYDKAEVDGLIAGAGNSFDKGFFADEAAIIAAHPAGEAGWKAVNGATDTIWVWDVESAAWVDSGASSSSLPVTALGTSGAQTVDRSISDKWTLTPSAAVTLADSNFTTLLRASLAITNGGLQTINIPSAWVRVGAGSFEFSNNDVDVLNLVYDGTQITVEHVPPIPITSYLGTYSTGDRRSQIVFTTDVPVLTNANIDGNTTNNEYPGITAYTGLYLQFEFPEAIYMDEFIRYNDNTPGRTEGTWQLNGSNNGIDWSSLGAPMIFDTSNPDVHSITNPGWYKYLKFIATADAVSGNAGWAEFEFKTN